MKQFRFRYAQVLLEAAVALIILFSLCFYDKSGNKENSYVLQDSQELKLKQSDFVSSNDFVDLYKDIRKLQETNKNDKYAMNLQKSVHRFVHQELKYSPDASVSVLTKHVRNIFDFSNLSLHIELYGSKPFALLNSKIQNVEVDNIYFLADSSISQLADGRYLVINLGLMSAKRGSDVNVSKDLEVKLDTMQKNIIKRPSDAIFISHYETPSKESFVFIFSFILVIVFTILRLFDRYSIDIEIKRIFKLIGNKNRKNSSSLVDVRKSIESVIVELNDAKSQLRDMANSYEEFIADSAHQLGTPLTSIMMNLDLITMSDEKSQINEFVIHIKAAVSFLMIYENELIYLSCNQEMTHRPVLNNISQVVYDRSIFFSNIRHGIQRKINFSIEPNINAIVNPMELEYLVNNNIAFLIKHSNINVDINVLLKVKSQNIAILRFESEGKEISEEKNIFDKYYRGESAHRGYGLGLAISKKIANKYGVKILLSRKENINILEYAISCA